MAKFIKYPKTRNHTDEVYMEKIKKYVPDKMIWRAKEKIDGQNFSVILTRDTTGEIKIIFSRRNNIIRPEESFSNYELIATKYKDNFKAAFKYAEKTYGALTQMNIFGELYGGYWIEKVPISEQTEQTEQTENKHAKYRRVKTKVDKIIGRVAYTPGRGFAAFKTFIVGTNEQSNWLSEEGHENLCKISGIPFVPTLAMGTLQEMLDLNVESESIISKSLHNLDIIKGNYMEGIIISPETPIFIKNSLVIIKKKSTAFCEKSFIKSQPAVKPDLSEEVDFETLNAMICESRVHSVRSNLSNADSLNIGIVIRSVKDDILNDYELEAGALLKEHYKAVSKIIGPNIAKLVRKMLL